ncbi:hypothetical protein ANCDUO_11915, partial [Ancylostoma duodenale]
VCWQGLPSTPHWDTIFCGITCNHKNGRGTTEWMTLCLVGALPFKSMQDDLVKKENVGGVVCCVEDYELKLAYNAIKKEQSRNVKRSLL